MIVSSAEQLTEVALACGFADQSHFTRSFRRMVGMSPSLAASELSFVAFIIDAPLVTTLFEMLRRTVFGNCEIASWETSRYAQKATRAGPGALRARRRFQPH